MTKRPDNEVSKFALYYREYREAKKNGTYIPKTNYTPALCKDDLLEFNITIVPDDSEFGYKITKFTDSSYIYKVYINAGGYPVFAYKNKEGKQRMMLLHRAVYAAFKGDIPAGMTVDHIDYNKLNNSVDNLQLLTRAQNRSKGDGISRTKTKEIIEARKLEVAAKRLARQEALKQARIDVLERRKIRLQNGMNRLRKATVHSKNVHGEESAIYKRILSQNLYDFEVYKNQWLSTINELENLKK